MASVDKFSRYPRQHPEGKGLGQEMMYSLLKLNRFSFPQDGFLRRRGEKGLRDGLFKLRYGSVPV